MCYYILSITKSIKIYMVYIILCFFIINGKEDQQQTSNVVVCYDVITFQRPS
jgi:hypothetical protein